VLTAYSSTVGIDTRSPKSHMRGIILLSDENETFARLLFIIARRRSNDTRTKVYMELVITNTGPKFTILQRISPGKKNDIDCYGDVNTNVSSKNGWRIYEIISEHAQNVSRISCFK
jgi:hypothetical protein